MNTIHTADDAIDSLIETGGFSWGIEAPNHGYMVAINGTEIRLHVLSYRGIVVDTIRAMKRHQSSPLNYIGGWRDGEYIYLDESVWVADEAAAIQLGYEQRQIAIYDIKNQETITL